MKNSVVVYEAKKSWYLFKRTRCVEHLFDVFRWYWFPITKFFIGEEIDDE